MKHGGDSNGPEDPDIPPLRIAMAVVPKFTAALSLMGSYIILRELNAPIMVRGKGKVNQKNGANEKKNNNNKPNNTTTTTTTKTANHMMHNRTLSALTLADIVLTIGFGLTTWPIPAERDDVWGNVGNQATCTTQAVWIQFGWWTLPLWNLALAITAVLLVQYQWTESQLRRLEPWMHGIIWTTGLGSALFPIPMGLFNAGQFACWFIAAPFRCKQSYFFGDEAANCERGDNANLYQVAFTVFPLGPCVIGVAICFGIIYRAIWKLERGRRTSTTGTLSDQQIQNDRSQVVAIHALLRIAGFFATFILSLLRVVILFTTNGVNLWVLLFAYAMTPLQGFFNLLVHLRNCQGRPLKTPEGRLVQRALRWMCCCCRRRGSLLLRRRPGFEQSSSGEELQLEQEQPLQQQPDDQQLSQNESTFSSSSTLSNAHSNKLAFTSVSSSLEHFLGGNDSLLLAARRHNEKERKRNNKNHNHQYPNEINEPESDHSNDGAMIAYLSSPPISSDGEKASNETSSEYGHNTSLHKAMIVEMDAPARADPMIRIESPTLPLSTVPGNDDENGDHASTARASAAAPQHNDNPQQRPAPNLYIDSLSLSSSSSFSLPLRRTNLSPEENEPRSSANPNAIAANETVISLDPLPVVSELTLHGSFAFPTDLRQLEEEEEEEEEEALGATAAALYNEDDDNDRDELPVRTNRTTLFSAASRIQPLYQDTTLPLDSSCGSTSSLEGIHDV